MTGIKIASILSPIFSIKHDHPFSIESSRSLMIFLDPSLTHLSELFFSFSLIHVIPYNYGSIIRGYLSVFVNIVPFSVETISEGSPYLFHEAILASSVINLMGFRFGLQGIPLSLKYLVNSILINYSLYCLLKGPV